MRTWKHWVALLVTCALCSCSASDQKSPDSAEEGIPTSLSRYLGDDGLLMVPQLATREGTPDLATSAFALQLLELSGADPLLPDAAAVESVESQDGSNDLRNSWYSVQLEKAAGRTQPNSERAEQVIRSQDEQGWFTTPDAGGAPLDTVIDDASKAVDILTSEGSPPSSRWQERLRGAAVAVEPSKLSNYSRWELLQILRATGAPYDNAHFTFAGNAPTPPTDDLTGEDDVTSLMAFAGLGGHLDRSQVQAWADWLASSDVSIGLRAATAKSLVALDPSPRVRQAVRTAAEDFAQEHQLPSGLFKAPENISGDLQVTYFMLLLSKLQGHAFTDETLARTLREHPVEDTDPAVKAWGAAVRERAVYLAEGRDDGTSAGDLPWIGDTQASGGRILPELAVLSVDLGSTVPDPVAAEGAVSDPSTAANVAVAQWVAHDSRLPWAVDFLPAWADLVRDPTVVNREFFIAATAILITQGVDPQTQWVVDLIQRRTDQDGDCQNSRILVAEQPNGATCDLRSSLAAFLAAVASRGDSAIARIRT